MFDRKVTITLYSPISILLLGLFMLSSACSTQVKSVEQAGESQEFSFKQGQYISFVAPQSKDNGNDARQEYYQRAFSLADGYGLKREIQFNVTEKVVGDFDANAFILFSWPNKTAEEKLYAHPEWPSIKALRPQAWEELRIYSTVVQKGFSLNFKSDKFYTVGIAWLNPQTASEYTNYLDGIEATLDKLGARYIHQMLNPSFEAHNTSRGAPAQLTFVEWDSEEALNKLQKSEGFKQNYAYFKNSVTAFELFRLKPVLK